MKWAQREAVDVTFKAKSTMKLGPHTYRAGEPIMILDTVTTANFEVAAETTYVTGGRGNARQLSFQGDKTTTFSFTDATLSNEGLALLAGAELIPARNANLQGASPEAQSVIAPVYKEKYAVITNNIPDVRAANIMPDDDSLYPSAGPAANVDYSPRGGLENVWIMNRPYVGQNADIYIWLLDRANEGSGAAIQINLNNTGLTDAEKLTIANGTATDAVIKKADSSYLAKFGSGDYFVAFDDAGLPMPIDPGSFLGGNNGANLIRSNNIYPDLTVAANQTKDNYAAFDDQVKHYVYFGNTGTPGTVPPTPTWWLSAWGPLTDFAREITASNYGSGMATPGYAYLLAPSGGVAQPRAYKEGGSIVYKVNVPSILYQDIVLVDYYHEHKHDATQISILPDKFGEYVYVEGFTTVKRKYDGKDLDAVFVIPKFLITTGITLTFQATGDAATFDFAGDAYPDFTKFNLTREVLADIIILGADDNYDGAASYGAAADPTSYRRFQYNEDTDGAYIWKDPSMEPHQNLDFSDTGSYISTDGGPSTITPGQGLIDTDAPDNV